MVARDRPGGPRSARRRVRLLGSLRRGHAGGAITSHLRRTSPPTPTCCWGTPWPSSRPSAPSRSRSPFAPTASWPLPT